MPPLIGTDISSSAIKMVEIMDAGKSMYRVERYAIEPLPRDSVVEGDINNIGAVSDALKRAHKRLGSSVKNLALALPNAAVISKRILVPAGLSEEDLELAVQAEANQYIPFSLDEVNIDFQVLGPAPNSPDDVEILIAASRKEKIEDRVAATEQAGLKAAVVDVDVFAAQTAFELIEDQFPERGKDQNIAMVEIDVTDFGTPVRTIDAFTQGAGARVVIEPRGNWEHTAYQTDTRFIIEVKQQIEDPNRLVKPGFVGCRSTSRAWKCARCCRSSPISRGSTSSPATPSRAT
jgi:hypothetical protein